MILYFTDRSIKVIGLATSDGRNGLTITTDKLTDSVGYGVKTLELTVSYDEDKYNDICALAKPANYILAEIDGEQLFFTIIETTLDHRKRTATIYAEDGGLDMINDVVGEYNATSAHPIEFYVSKYIDDSGFEIGNNGAKSQSKNLSFSSEETATERLKKIAEEFGADLSYRFVIDGLTLNHKYIDIAAKRGENNGVRLYINREVENITITQDASDLATALHCIGGVPEGKSQPITLYDYIAQSEDNDYFTPANDKKVYCRSAMENFTQYTWNGDTVGYGTLVKRFKYETLSQEELFKAACAELAKVKDINVTYDVDIAYLGNKKVSTGDTVYIVDDSDEIYLEARVIELERSESDNYIKLKLGEYVRKGAGINERLLELAAQFQQQTEKLAVVVESVDGKTKTYYSSTEPTGVKLNNGDIWVNGDVLKVYQDGAWVEPVSYTDDTAVNELAVVVDDGLEEAISIGTTAKNIAEAAKTNAATALTYAQGAQGAADNAKLTADGKNTVFYQPAAPSTVNRKVNDIWFDTDDGNSIHYWNGSAWVKKLLGENAIEDLNARKITAGTIDASKVAISNLDAGNITSGYLNSDRIQAGSMTIGKIAQSAQQSIVNQVNVGGRNLIQGTQTFDPNLWNNTILGVLFSADTYMGGKVAKITATQSTAVNTTLIPKEPSANTSDLFVAGRQYTFSAYIKGCGTNTIPAHFSRGITNRSTAKFSGDIEAVVSADALKTGNWYRVSFTCTCTTSGWLLFGVYRTTSRSASEEVSIALIQVEEGNKATSWKPAPEDTPQAIETLFNVDTTNISLKAGKKLSINAGTFEVDASNYKLNANGTVEITGGKIGGFDISDSEMYASTSRGDLHISSGNEASERQPVIEAYYRDSSALFSPGQIALHGENIDHTETFTTNITEGMIELRGSRGNRMFLSPTGATVNGSKLLSVPDLVVTSHTIVSGLSIAASTTDIERTVTISKDGYTPIGIVGQLMSGTNSMYCNLYLLYIANRVNGSGVVHYRIRNNSAGNASVTLKADVLWVKN